MQDLFGRTIEYLRLSVTTSCNLRCLYCMGDECVCKNRNKDILTLEELVEIAEASVECGIKKIRITGGEPLVRNDLTELCRRLKAIKGLEELNITTNGILLKNMALDLKHAGVDRLNISLDTLKADRYEYITGCGKLAEALDGIAAAADAGFTDIKINVVLIGGFNDDEISDFVALTKKYPVCVRFIELMPIGVCADWPEESFISCDKVLEAANELTYIETKGEARLYKLPDGKGTVGLISPISHCFCSSCNRLRVTADGRIKPCLHSEQEYVIRGMHGSELAEAFRMAAMNKPAAHNIINHGSDTKRNMNEIGG